VTNADDDNAGGGLWHPEAAPTAAMRKDIDRDSGKLKGILIDENVRKSFLKGAPKNESKVVKAFVASNSGNALKTKPKVSLPLTLITNVAVALLLCCLI